MTATAFELVTVALERVTGYRPREGCDWRCPAHHDSTASLSVNQGSKGVILHCHAGCDTGEVLARLDLTAADLFDGQRDRPERPQITASYPYLDEGGRLLFTVHRFEPKTFRQQAADGSWKLNGVRRVLYRLPELRAAASEGRRLVYVTEGEKDADAIVRAGGVATCNPMGAGKWQPDFADMLAGFDQVVVVADRDVAGYRHARQVRDSLSGPDVRIVEALAGKDAADHLGAGFTLEQLRPVTDLDGLCGDSGGMSSAGNESESPAAPGDYARSDLGNARRLVDSHGEDLRYVPQWRQWLVWDGRRWRPDITGAADRRAKEVAETILHEAVTEQDKQGIAFGLKSCNVAGVRNMLASAATEPGIPVEVHQLDADPYLLTVANGTLDLRTGRLRPASRADLITKSSPVEWASDATCPTFDRFLEDILPDADVRRFVQRAAGYSLAGVTTEHVLLICYGSGANGKSTLMEILQRLLGDHAAPASPRLLVVEKHSEHPTAIADLHGRRMVISQEIQDGQRLDEALVKQLTGGDTLKGRLMKQDFWSFTPTHTLWLSTNHKPKIRGTDQGVWRRIRLIPFDITIPEHRQDKDLHTKLLAELPGILTWAVQGCRDWQHHGLDAPRAVTEATDRYRLESDLLAQYLDERTVSDPGAYARSTDLYEDYRTWCAANGLDHPLTQKAIAKQLDERGYDRTENRLGQSVWVGLGLITDRGPIPDPNTETTP
ncbi:MAG: DNA primase [Acidobacteriota bacterium]|nr:DNA primase [Acidobacteriota bacterium]